MMQDTGDLVDGKWVVWCGVGAFAAQGRKALESQKKNARMRWGTCAEGAHFRNGENIPQKQGSRAKNKRVASGQQATETETGVGKRARRGWHI